MYTPTTPGIAAAAAVSTASIVAWTYGGRTIAIHTMPGIVQSSMYRACPVSRSGSSLRRTGCPMNRSVVTIVPPQARAPLVWPAASRIDSTMFW